MPSSVIRAMQYRPRRRELLIVFRGGRGTYVYRDVPPSMWEAFRSALSKGTFLNEVFKAVDYPYEKLAHDHQRPAQEDDNSEHDTELLEWGETWALPETAKAYKTKDQ